MEFRDTDLTTSAPKRTAQEELLGIESAFSQGEKVYLTLPGGERTSFTFKPKGSILNQYLLGFLGSGAASGLMYHPHFVADDDSDLTLRVKNAENTRLIRKANSDEYVEVVSAVPYNPAATRFGGVYILETGDGVEYEIDADSGDLLQVTDTNDNQLSFSEGGIVSSTGVSVTFERDILGRIVAAIDPEGNKIKYEYDTQGDLVGVVDREGNTTGFEYDSQRKHYLTEIIDPLGRSGVRSEYDLEGRLKRIIDVNGEAVELVYDPDNSLQTVRDVFGHETIYEYDERGNVVTEIDAVGLVTQRSYDDDNNLKTETLITDESGVEGWTTRYSYDADGNKLSETDALGNVTRYTYGKYNQLLTSTDALGNTTSYTYDSRGNVLSKTDAAGNTVQYTYDRYGNNLSIIEGENDITTFAYDSRGNKIKQTDALGNVTTYTHDFQGNILTETTTLTTPEGIRTLVTTKTYDKEGNETSVLDAEGNLTQYEYDANNNRTAIINPLGHRTINRYDEKNNLIETIYPDDTPLDLSDNLKIQTEYDQAGNRTSVTDQTGNTTYYTYDPLNRPTGLITPDDTPLDLSDNPRITVEYNQAGQMVALINELENRTEYEYDPAGRIILTRQFIDGQAIETTTDYDAAGQTIASTDAFGRTTRYIYDALGNVIETIFPDGTKVKTEYDAFGNEIAKTDQAGNVTRFEYDALDQLTTVINALEKRTEYQYDEAGNLVSQKDANSQITRFKYDGLGRQTATVRPLGQKSLTLYDEVGNVTSTTDFNGETILYEYDENNLLTKKRFEDETTVEFSYEEGKLTTITDERGITSYQYNDEGRLFSRTEPDGTTISYTYNDAGQTQSIITPSQTISYTYDEFNRLNLVTANGQTTDYDYDVVGNLVKTTLANGVVETRRYDDLNRLIEVVNTDAAGQVISSYEYTLDAVGNRTFVEELGGRTVSYDYDNSYRLLSEEITDGVNGNRRFDYTYDAVGNRLTLRDSVNGLTTYSYNANDWLLNETQAGVTTIYSYDSNGNVIGLFSPDEQVVYDWHSENRLIGVERTTAEGTSNLEYQYDPNGVRVASIVDGVETRYLVDTNRQYAQVLEEYSADGTTEVSYVYGNSLISMQRGGEEFVYLNDGHSGVRFLSDEMGAVSDSYVYDAYGNLLSSTGDTENNYLYRGEQFDPNLGMQYLRARYYDPSLGRLASVDPFEGMVEEPMSRHRYLYGYDNPVTYIDPSGMIPTLAGLSAANTIQNDLNSRTNVFATAALLALKNRISDNIRWTGAIGTGTLGDPLGRIPFVGAFASLILTSECIADYTPLSGYGAIGTRIVNARYGWIGTGISIGELYFAIVGLPVEVYSPRIYGLSTGVLTPTFSFVGLNFVGGAYNLEYFWMGKGWGYSNSPAPALTGNSIGASTGFSLHIPYTGKKETCMTTP
ncbi:MAG: hypothetical protein F6K45_24165 [Kamptonema sp. SIO1D9]|nr:hypothetical protein [Kamptonema sp. SIO1D9]